MSRRSRRAWLLLAASAVCAALSVASALVIATTPPPVPALAPRPPAEVLVLQHCDSPVLRWHWLCDGGE